MWKGAKCRGEAVRVMSGTAGISSMGDVLKLAVAKFLQSLMCLAGPSLYLCLESSAEVVVVQACLFKTL